MNVTSSFASHTKRFCLFQVLGISFIACVLQGCGGSSTSLVKVKGKISVDGTPASGAILLFHPESSTNATVCSAIADENGVYSPLTDIDEGIAEGSYRVTVVWPDPKVKGSGEGSKFGVAETRDPPDLLGGKFSSKATSKLTITVTGSSTELSPIEISKK